MVPVYPMEHLTRGAFKMGIVPVDLDNPMYHHDVKLGGINHQAM